MRADEQAALHLCVAKHREACPSAQISWAAILHDPDFGHLFVRDDGARRTAQDLKDKWTLLMREQFAAQPAAAGAAAEASLDIWGAGHGF